ncbi:MAG TPA: trehalose-phosphatase [Xanthomonadales bacterium]|nr:trehalose-phosphatase [Xanthomonadales bacterium]
MAFRARTHDPYFCDVVTPDGWALFFDVDGTLVEFRSRPERVFAPRDLVASLIELQRRFAGAVAFVSGRTIADLDRIFFPLRLAAAGVHGAELRRAGSHEIVRLAREPLLDASRPRFREFCERHPGAFLEDKDLSIVLHTRACPAASEGASRLAEQMAAQSGGRLALQRGSHVAELRASGVDKGIALRRLLATPPFRDRRPMVFGDDLADADAFRACGELGGLAVAVGKDAPPAPNRLASIHACREVVHRLAEEGRRW